MATINFLPPLPLDSPNSDATPHSTSSKLPAARKKFKPPPRNKNTAVRVKEKIVKPTQESRHHFIEEIDPASYRNSIFHNICTAVLTEGFHEAFTEFFTLIEKQRQEHKVAGPAAILLSPLIDNDEDKLRYLVSRLKEAESAKRKEELDVVYMNQRDLALHFEDTGDRWLADHFHSCCLETGRCITGDNRRKEGEAHLHVGLAYENREEYEDCVKHLLQFYELARKHHWHKESGERLYPIACEHLRRVYTKMAEKSESVSSSVDLLIKAHQIAKESGDNYQEGVANYRLGCAYERIEDYDKAIKAHRGYLERCRYHRDQLGASTAYRALSRCYETLGDIENAVKYLELYVEVAEGIESKETVTKAYCNAGIMFNTLGEYEKAVSYFSRSYDLSKKLEATDKKGMESTRVHYGIAQTHHKLMSFYEKIGQSSDNGIKDLVHWKGTRQEQSVTSTDDNQSYQHNGKTDTEN